MGNIAVKAERLCKKYSITVGRCADQSLAGRLAHSVQRLISFEGSGRKIHYQREDVWSLKDVSFEIAKGELVGIIGRNGAGKSTLLKVLSRITEPTSGRGEISGRVGTLLEVGTGFHPDLTGRDNIYLSGSILGMGKLESPGNSTKSSRSRGLSNSLIRRSSGTPAACMSGWLLRSARIWNRRCWLLMRY